MITKKQPAGFGGLFLLLIEFVQSLINLAMRIMRVIVDRIDTARNLQELFALVIELCAVFVDRSFDAVQLIFDA